MPSRVLAPPGKARLGHRDWGPSLVPDTSPARLTARSYGTTVSGTTPLTDLALPRTSPSRTVTGTGGVSSKR
jgi:hypothetical protein